MKKILILFFEPGRILIYRLNLGWKKDSELKSEVFFLARASRIQNRVLRNARLKPLFHRTAKPKKFRALRRILERFSYKSLHKTKRTKPMAWYVCLARPRGFEPLTYRFVAGHSIR